MKKIIINKIILLATLLSFSYGGTLERNISDECKGIEINSSMIWDGKNKEIPEKCKKTIVTTVGHLTPMKIHKDVETYGEVEVIKFIEDMKKDKSLLLVDIREEDVCEKETIPGAVNIPHIDVESPVLFPIDNKKACRMLGVYKKEGKRKFDKAKTVLLFCNAKWCGQSPRLIEYMIDKGYPPEKIKWYRGGLQDWISVGLPTEKSEYCEVKR